jgi:hypothetical protein
MNDATNIVCSLAQRDGEMLESATTAGRTVALLPPSYLDPRVIANYRLPAFKQEERKSFNKAAPRAAGGGDAWVEELARTFEEALFGG